MYCVDIWLSSGTVRYGSVRRNWNCAQYPFTRTQSQPVLVIFDPPHLVCINYKYGTLQESNGPYYQARMANLSQDQASTSQYLHLQAHVGSQMQVNHRKNSSMHRSSMFMHYKSDHWWNFIVLRTFTSQDWIENFRMSRQTFDRFGRMPVSISTTINYYC